MSDTQIHVIERVTADQPYIGPNKTWILFDADNKQWVDTGIVAEGKDGVDGKDGVSVHIVKGTYREPGSSKPFPDLPPIENVPEGYAYVVDDDAIAGQYDLYYKGVGGTDWTIIDNWGGIPGQNGKDGKDGAAGKDGKDGADGKDGNSPYIGANGNWFIGTQDTGIKAKGEKGDKGEAGIAIGDILSKFSLNLRLSNEENSGVRALEFKVDTYATAEDIRSIDRLVSSPKIAVRPILIGVVKRSKTCRYMSQEVGGIVRVLFDASNMQRKKFEVTKKSHAGGLFFDLFDSNTYKVQNTNTWIDIKDSLKSYLNQFVMVRELGGKNYIWNNRRRKCGGAYFPQAVAMNKIGSTLLVRMKLAVVLDCGVLNTTPTKYLFNQTHFIGDHYELKVYCRAHTPTGFYIDNIYLA